MTDTKQKPDGITPYYQDNLCTIYHGDCREILPQIEKVDLVLTDPPYGIGNFVQITGNVRGEEVTWNEQPPSKDTLDLIKRMSKKQIIWGANYFNCFDLKGGAIVWVKNQPMPDFSKADIASCSFYSKVEIVIKTWTNFVNDKVSKHPCERPISLYEWCINYAGSPETILDPFMGSGTTLVAAKNLGRRSIGIEKEQKYCDIAIKRLKQETIFSIGVEQEAKHHE